MSGEDEEREEREGLSFSSSPGYGGSGWEAQRRAGPSDRWRPLSTAAADDEVALVDVPGRRNVWW